MREPIFTGSGVAIVTPFSNGAVNFAALKRLLDFHLENSTDAIVVCGTTGEAATMSYQERMQTIETVVDYIDGRIPVIAGSGSNNTETAVTLSRDAAAAGADALLVVTPYYNKATQQGLIRHYNVIADAVDLPIIVYEVPSRTGVTIMPKTYAELAKHPNLNGIKEASGSLSNLQKTRNLCPEDFYVWSGNDDETVPICALGGIGVISVVANLLPREMHTLVRLCMDNDFAAAGQLQLHLKEFCDAMFCEVNPIPIKAAMNLVKMDVGELRLPLCDPSPEHLLLLQNVLRKYGISAS